jgi:hypothetical protein
MEELKMALLAMNGIEHFATDHVSRCVAAIKSGKPALMGVAAAFGEKWEEERICSLRNDPLVYLGEGNIPGTEENNTRRACSKALFKAATGIDLDAEGAK